MKYKINRKLLLTVTIVDSKQFTTKSKLIIYNEVFINLYN